ncbi:putative reverse transcriptase zinc-binding domain-containing protein [Helianthus annuus]|nr:putative reverse transcriptase zinc-binding domain-containing protein [Helianthus annuus]
MEYHALITEVQGLSRNGMADKWTWGLEASGDFSVRSLRNIMQQKTFQKLESSSEWNRWSPIKVNFLIWRLVMDRLPTMVNLAKRNIQVGSLMCKLCGESEETSEHLFVSCGLTQSIWDFVGSWCRLYGFFLFDVKDVLGYHRMTRGTKEWKKVVYTIIQTTIWCIWRARNNATFNGKQPLARNLKEEIRVLGYLWVKNRARFTELGKNGAILSYYV